MDLRTRTRRCIMTPRYRDGGLYPFVQPKRLLHNLYSQWQHSQQNPNRSRRAPFKFSNNLHVRDAGLWGIQSDCTGLCLQSFWKRLAIGKPEPQVPHHTPKSDALRNSNVQHITQRYSIQNITIIINNNTSNRSI